MQERLRSRTARSDRLQRRVRREAAGRFLLAMSPIAFLLALQPSHAAVFTLSNNGPNTGTTAFTGNPNGIWGAGTHPVSGNEYDVNGWVLWTPTTSASFVNGAVLRVNAAVAGDPDPGPRAVGLLGMQADGATFTIPDLRLDNGGLYATRNHVVQGLITLEGDGYIYPSLTGRSIAVGAEMTGAGNVFVEGSTGGVVTYTDVAKDYSGDTTVRGNATLSMGLADAMPDDPTDGDLIVESTGTFQASGNNTTIQGLSGSGIVENASGTPARLTIQGDVAEVNDTFAGTIRNQATAGGGALSLTKTGDTRQTFTGTSNTYSGGTIIEDGQLQLKDGGTLGTGPVEIAGAGSGTLELDNTNLTLDLDLEGRSTDTAHIDNVAGNNEISGNLTLVEEADPNDPALFTIDSSAGDLLILGDITYAGAESRVLNLGGASTGEVSGTIDLSAADPATSTLEKEGAGTWTLSGQTTVDMVNVNAGQLNLGNTLTTTGDVSVASGATLQQQGIFIDRTTQAGNLNVDGTLDVNGNSASINALDGSGTVDNTDATATTLSLGSAGGGNFSGDIQDTGGALSIVKDGSGTQSIGEIDIDGTIAVDDGTLAVTGTTTSGDIDVASGAGLSMTGAASTGEITSSGDIDADALVTTNGNSVTIDDGTADFSAGLNTGSATTTVNDGEASIAGYTGGILDVNGGVANMSGTGNFGAADVSGGELNVLSQDALDGSGATSVSGTGRVNIGGASHFTNIDEVFNLAASGGGVQLNNVANENTITGSVNLVASNPAGAEQFRIESESGTLNLSGGVVSSLTVGNEILNLGGAGNGTVSSLDMATADASSILKDGDGEWTVSNATMDDGTISSQNGILALGSGANLTGSMVYEVLAGAELDVTGLGGLDVADTQTLRGGGLVDGDVIAADGAIVSVGDSSVAGQDLEITGSLQLAGELALDVSNSLIDSLIVGDDLTLTNATLDLVGALTANVYILAQYGGIRVGEFDTTVAGYSFDYSYGSGGQIALVSDNPTVVPMPAPLALIGLGALVWGGLRRARTVSNA
jgi:fibronectin-binding autotransporter adhesin